MKNIDVIEFKECINELQNALEDMVKNDSSYEGEADELINAIKRLKVAFGNVTSINEFEPQELEKIMPDFALVMGSLETIAEAAEEESEIESE